MFSLKSKITDGVIINVNYEQLQLNSKRSSKQVENNKFWVKHSSWEWKFQTLNKIINVVRNVNKQRIVKRSILSDQSKLNYKILTKIDLAFVKSYFDIYFYFIIKYNFIFLILW